MLIHNVDMSDLLCNGALGFLIGIETSKGGNVEMLIVKFDNPKAGKQEERIIKTMQKSILVEQ